VVVTVIPTLPPLPSPVSEATSSPAPSETPAPSATPTAAVPVGEVIFTEDFSQAGQWFLGEEDEFRRAAIADGKLSITLKVADRFALIFNTQRPARDFYASVMASAAACQFRDRYGLLFRLSDDANYYQLDVDCDGRYRLSKVVGGTLTALKDWTASDAIHSGGLVNELGVRAFGPALEVFASGQSLFTVSDSTFSDGGFGLIAGSGPQSLTYTAEFDDLSVWEVTQ